MLNFKSADTEAMYRRLTKVVWHKFERKKQMFFFLMFEVVNLIIMFSIDSIKIDVFIILIFVILSLLGLVQWLI